MIDHASITRSHHQASTTATGNSMLFQPKLSVNQSNDLHEQEADAIAEKVASTGNNESSHTFFKPATSFEQRKCAHCEQEEKLQLKLQPAQQSSPDISSNVYEVINSSGQELDKPARDFMEPKFGHDFSNVRIHNDENAHQSSLSINARAYTHQNHIVFGAGQYQPDTVAGKQLLAHELTHVVQQNGGTSYKILQRKLGDGHDLTSQRFSGNEILESCFDGEQDKYLLSGATGEAVVKVQQTLIELGFDLPQFGADGHFGDETGKTVSRFKSANNISPSDPVVGKKTISKMDEIVAENEKKNKIQADCKETTINEEKEPLPDIPFPTITHMNANKLFELVKRRQTPGAFVPPNPPLGATQPIIENIKPAKAKAIPVEGTDCFKCIAEWEMVKPKVDIFIANGTFSDEPKRIFVARQGDISGCTQGISLKEVIKLILPEAEPKLLEAELEHWSDFIMSYMLIGGRYLSNIRRLTQERTHLRGKTEQECIQKVSDFLMNTTVRIPVNPLDGFGFMLADDLTGLYNFNTEKRDKNDHNAISKPPKEKLPLFPNIDIDKNPFGCKAYFRKFDKDLAPHVPGPGFIQIMEDPDQNIPPQQTWHTL